MRSLPRCNFSFKKLKRAIAHPNFSSKNLGSKLLKTSSHSKQIILHIFHYYGYTLRLDIEQINSNLSFSMFLFQDGWIQPAFVEKGKIRYITKDAYLFIKLTKVAKQRYVLHALHEYYEGGDDYYDIDLRNLSKPIIKQIDLATAQRLGKSVRNR